MKGLNGQFMNKEKKSKVVKSMLGIGIICAIVAIVMVIRGIGVQPSINENREKIAELEGKIAEEKERQAEVDRMKENADTDEYAEKVARDQLGMVKQDEIVFYDVSEK